jgi:hypothetical protein
MTDAPSVQASRSGAAQRAALVIERYAPCSVSEAASAFAREVVGAAGPERPARAKALLFAAGRIAAFGERVGLELDAQALLCEAVIERFIARATQGFSSATRRTLRTNLRALARALDAHPQPLPVALPRERAKAPYSPAEIDGYLRLAAAQSTEARRMRATALICLGAGAGSSQVSFAGSADVTWWRAPAGSWWSSPVRKRAQCRCSPASRSRWPRPPPLRGSA